MSESETLTWDELLARSDETTWQRLLSSGHNVTAAVPNADVPRDIRHLVRRAGIALAVATAALAGAVSLASHPTVAAANGTADSALFALTNQDRSSNGVASLRSNATLNHIGEATSYPLCGIHVAGRAQDMINRSYFSHYIPPCNQLVFVIMQEAGIHYTTAGENVGWTGGLTDPSAAAAYVNTQFMNSPDHRANILNSAYTDLGIGSAFASTWHGAGTQSNVWMFSEEFTKSSASAPRPVKTPAPHKAPPVPKHNATTPAPIRITPVTTSAPTPRPTAQPTPTATAIPTPTPTANPFATPDPSIVPPPLITAPGGLLSDSVESVLESFLLG